MEPGTVARVLKDVFTTMDGELCLSKGDVFQVIKPIDRYWCYGNSAGRIGRFPTDQLISIETPELNDSEELFLAVADFNGEQDGDLSFRKGEFIIGEGKLDEHWWQGRVNQYRKGVFPDTFTWLLGSTPQRNQKNNGTMNMKARVKLSLKAQLDEEMDLHVGDIVTIVDEPDKGWYRGICGDRSGIFPSAYVTLLDEQSVDDIHQNSHPNIFNNFPNNSASDSSKNNNILNASQSCDSFSGVRNSYTNVDVQSPSKDLMTFSPEKEVKPPLPPPKPADVIVSTELDILNDDYFKLNMPSMYTGHSSLESNSATAFGFDSNTSRSSYLADLVSELDDCNIQPYGMTLYPFYAQYANELSFHENEIVHLIRYVDDGWLEGEIDGRKGIFPVSYVNIVVDCDRGWRGHASDLGDTNIQQNLTPRSHAKVMYNFDAQMNGDLSVKEGDVVMIMKVVDNDWCEVRNLSGNTGLCPSNHLAPHDGSPSTALFRSSSFTCDLEPSLDVTKPRPRTFEPHDFPVELKKKENKVEDLITRNLSGLEIKPLKRRSPIEKSFIDFKEELNVVKGQKDGKNEAEHCDSSDGQESVPDYEPEPPDYPPPPPPIRPKPPVDSVPSKPLCTQLDDPKPSSSITLDSKECNDQNMEKVKYRAAPPAPDRPKRPPLPSRRASIDRAPHRPAPPVPIAGQTPVRKSLKRLPRQTSAPCVFPDEVSNSDEVRELIMRKEKQLQEIQMVHEEIETELEQTPQNDSRAEELRECGAMHQRKMRRLKMDIQHYRAKLHQSESASSSSQKQRISSAKCIEERRKKLKEQRQNVISELVLTEKEYVRDLKITYETFNLHNPTMLEDRGIDVKILFGNLFEVMQAAEVFLDSFLFAMKGRSDEDQCVGPVFLKHAENIKKVYSEYCANHESALGLLEKYKTVPAAQSVFDKAMETLRYQITCFDVGSVLIKPVQRLLKYPLILNELIKCTEDQHKDKSDLLQAVQVYTKMASDINEYKRRMDIVSKYLVDGTSTLARKMAKLNLHSVAKKSSRLSAKLSSSLGLSMAPKDERFLDQERSFQALDRTVKIFLRNIDSLLSHLNEEVTTLFNMGEILATFYMERKGDQDVDEFRTTQRLIMTQYWTEFKNVIERRVTSPLVALLELFEGPCKLIEKRNDKLLDYDNCLAKADKNKENRQFQDELFMSKNNYEALNQQLLEDLPIFIKSSSEILVECLAALLAAQKLMSGKITKQYLNLMEIPSLASAAGDAVDAFAVKHYLVCNQLGRFSFSSKSFRESGGNKKPMKTSPTPARQLGTDGHKLDQSAGQRAFLHGKYTADKLYSTSEDHAAAGPLELDLKKGHLVAVIKKQDPMGSSMRWFVDNGVAQGFVRSTCLEQIISRNSLSPSSSSARSSLSSCTTPSPNKLRPDSALSTRSSEMDLSPGLSACPPKSARKLSASSVPSNLPPSYEEVTRSNSSQAIYDEVPNEPQHRYDEVPKSSNDSFEGIRAVNVNHVESEDNLDSSCDSEFYYSSHEFPGMGPHTLPLKEGQVVNILQRQDLRGNKEWWYVEDRYGKKGYVPANYLNPYTDS